ncbi:MAG: universal stress protein UspA [Clostridiales Family XIII bacterium]|jgi:K+-sensing histidine kinase KdpD|nr:universal stress protein UspA [Clostridiales Family XIII bacterium]
MGKNVMVCVTQQRTCDRLIKYGREFLGDDLDELIILHVAHYQFKFLGNSQEGEALDYLYEKAREYGATLTVIRSADIPETLIEQVTKNNAAYVVMGESREGGEHANMAALLESRLAGRTELIIVPA